MCNAEATPEGGQDVIAAEVRRLAPEMFNAILALVEARHHGTQEFRSRSYDSDVQSVFDRVEKIAKNYGCKRGDDPCSH